MSSKVKKHHYLPLILGSLAVSLLGAGAFALVRGFLNSTPPPQKKVVQEIHVIRPPPPPPDLPPPPPPPPEEKVDVTEPEKQPDPTPSDEPPPSEQLGLDAEGGAGSDAFGLVGHKGGRDLLASGGSAFAWYGSLIKSELLGQLQEIKELRKGSYSAVLQLWISPDGTVSATRLTQSSGDKVRDKVLEAGYQGHRVSQPPPPGMPQPITVRIVSRA